MTANTETRRTRRYASAPTAAALAGLALLGCACATASVVPAPEAINGRDLENAIAIYGPFDAKITIKGRTHYVWRKTVEVDGQHLGCELRAEVAYRNIVRQTQVEGYDGACAQFSVRYTSTPDLREEDPGKPEPDLKVATPKRKPAPKPKAVAAASSGREAER
ncbi:hypothetical protein [Phenylobacterium sp.]|uniref:hypothetical protein n=1 Tax=Phenylobacterium sp. TaxID=1871053 RepID=UPI002F959BF5